RTRRLGEDSGDVWDEIITTITGMSDTRERVADRIQLTGADGESVHDFALVPLPDGETMISFADVTDTVRMETVLTERNAALQAAERLKNAFFQHVSYELRTPLTSIKGFADVLAEGGFGPLNPKQAEYVSDIADASRELERMVDNLLDLAIVDAGRLELDLERTDLREVLAEATRSVGDLLRDKGVKLAVKSSLPQGKAAEIVADTNRLQQVLFNLLANAVRFSQAGEEIVLEARIEGDEAVIAVADTGPGVPEAQRETIFERFEGGRVGGATDTPSSGGAGLGLAIARSMIQLHEGSIALDDEYAEGARFVCRLPRALSRPSATV
ncbi:MAG: HAMP domain-containing sensor histidine kinase, partial [Pseudomonadota bacterium]